MNRYGWYLLGAVDLTINNYGTIKYIEFFIPFYINTKLKGTFFIYSLNIKICKNQFIHMWLFYF
jgi:dTDP-D-glucose 4,6-dehydratase